MGYPSLQIVIPACNEGPGIRANLGVIAQTLAAHGVPHGFIVVDDGSRDDTWAELLRFKESGAGLLALRLSRNFGKEAAICAGLDAVTAPFCVVMDADLQHPPEVIPQMLDTLLATGCDLVEGVKASRADERPLAAFFARAFYSVFRRLSGLELRDASDFKLFSLEVLEAWRALGDVNTFFRGMMQWVGFKKAQVRFQTAPRKDGATKFSFARLVKLAVDAITAFSVLPLHMTTLFGVLALVGALGLGGWTLYQKLSGGALTGFTTVILLQLILGAMILMSLGVIGLYISKIYQEVKGRPRYIVAERK
jgi:dolichol-phosphate mannosyltransferase